MASASSSGFGNSSLLVSVISSLLVSALAPGALAPAGAPRAVSVPERAPLNTDGATLPTRSAGKETRKHLKETRLHRSASLVFRVQLSRQLLMSPCPSNPSLPRAPFRSSTFIGGRFFLFTSAGCSEHQHGGIKNTLGTGVVTLLAQKQNKRREVRHETFRRQKNTQSGHIGTTVTDERRHAEVDIGKVATFSRRHEERRTPDTEEIRVQPESLRTGMLISVEQLRGEQLPEEIPLRADQRGTPGSTGVKRGQTGIPMRSFFFFSVFIPPRLSVPGVGEADTDVLVTGNPGPASATSPSGDSTLLTAAMKTEEPDESRERGIVSDSWACARFSPGGTFRCRVS
ncbi:hypothetical protein EYF80_042957 [Liparis tanakae]|uniref:Uncharacterized protein n=1 Tax=Liparis tanakae TaxID=230148 RepID=A0A4Z2FZU9_9TELE|nr:hypothetical protein EYF80_042957 [Liparis tanakae]